MSQGGSRDIHPSSAPPPINPSPSQSPSIPESKPSHPQVKTHPSPSPSPSIPKSKPFPLSKVSGEDHLKEYAARTIYNLLYAEHRTSPVVVDIGCGQGKDLALIRTKLAPEVRTIGIDINPALLEIARTNCPEAEFKEADMHALPFPDLYVDALYCCRVLYQSPNLAEALRELLRVLKPGGVGIFIEFDMRTNITLSADPRIQQVFAVLNAAMLKTTKQPFAAAFLYASLSQHPDVEKVDMDASTILITDYLRMDPGGQVVRSTLQGLVQAGGVSEEEMAYYLRWLEETPAKGEQLMVGTMFSISFYKKKG